jgi:hypothetical protein
VRCCERYVVPQSTKLIGMRTFEGITSHKNILHDMIISSRSERPWNGRFDKCDKGVQGVHGQFNNLAAKKYQKCSILVISMVNKEKGRPK